MRTFPLALIAILLASTGGATSERDAGCGPGVYCGDSPDNDGDPCTAQPDDPRTSDYDESRDDLPCNLSLASVPLGESEITAMEIVYPARDILSRQDFETR